jgi:hypothetical protein
MSNVQTKTVPSVTGFAALTFLALGFFAAGTPSATAADKPAAQSTAQSGKLVRRWQPNDLNGTYLMKPGHANPVDTAWVCKTAPEFCADYHGSNGG